MGDLVYLFMEPTLVMDVTYFQVKKFKNFEFNGIMIFWTPINIIKEVVKIYHLCWLCRILWPSTKNGMDLDLSVTQNQTTRSMFDQGVQLQIF